MTPLAARSITSIMSWRPQAAFVLAAGLGTRMRPLTDRVPKPLVPLAGRPLLDHVLDRIGAAGIPRVVVNVHYMAAMIETHLRARVQPAVAISDERRELLDTGGGAVRALPLLGEGAFMIHNCDTVWIEDDVRNLESLCNAFDAGSMDGLLLMADRGSSLGYDGRGDFNLAPDGRLQRRPAEAAAPWAFAGVSIASPRLFRGAPAGPFSLNLLWDRAIAEGRLFGLPLRGLWMHVGDPEALRLAEQRIASHGGP